MKFEAKNDEGWSPGPLPSMLAIPCYDGITVKGFDDLMDLVETIKDLPLTIINDFDIPWIAINKGKFPKLPKVKDRKKDSDSDDDSDEDGDSNDDDEDEDENDDDEDYTGSNTSSSSGFD